jgi:hypothetical protein
MTSAQDHPAATVTIDPRAGIAAMNDITDGMNVITEDATSLPATSLDPDIVIEVL